MHESEREKLSQEAREKFRVLVNPKLAVRSYGVKAFWVQRRHHPLIWEREKKAGALHGRRGTARYAAVCTFSRGTRSLCVTPFADCQTANVW